MSVRIALAIALLALIATLFVPYDAPSGDAYGYALALREDEPIPTNPNRLLLRGSVQKSFVWLAGDLGLELDPLRYLLWIARLSFVALTTLVFALVHRATREIRPAAVAALGFAASYTALYFGTDGEPMMWAHVSTFAGILALLIAWERVSRAWSLLAGVALAIGALLYVTNGLAVAIVGALSAAVARERRSLFPLIAPGVAVLLGIVAVGVAFGIQESDLPFLRWITSYGGGEASLSYGGITLVSLFRVVFGLGASFVSSRGAARLFRNWTEGEASIQPQAGDGLEFVLWVLALGGAGVLTFFALRALSRSSRVARWVSLGCFSGIAVLVLFNVRWIGSDPQFWLPVVPALWIFWGIGNEQGFRRFAVPATALLLLLMVFNVSTGLRPYRGDRRPLEARDAFLQEAAPRSLIVTPGLDWIDMVGEYYGLGNDREVLSLWRESARPEFVGESEAYYSMVEQTVNDSLDRGTVVYLRSLLDEPYPEGIPWREMAPRGFEFERLLGIFQEYRAEPAFVVGNDTYWRLGRGGSR